MDLRQYARVLRAHLPLIAVTLLGGIGIAAALAWTRPPEYTSSIQLFVSSGTRGDGATSTERYAAILLSQVRAASYARLVASPPVVQAVNGELGTSLSLGELQSKVTTIRPEGTVLLDVTVSDRSPEVAQAIAQALGNQVPAFLESLEGQEATPPVVTVASPAQLPTHPISPRKPLYLVLGMLVGLMLGVGGAVLREALWRRIRDPEDVATLTGLPVLGSIAQRRPAKREPLVMLERPGSARAEEFRRLRTNLNALIGGEVRSFVVTSSASGEGKTLIAANLGIAFARSGLRVVMVEADLRRPKLADIMGVRPNLGLSDVLERGLPFDRALERLRPDLQLDLLSAGFPPQNPTELLDSREFRDLLAALSARADLVILDSPALLPTADASVLTQMTAGAVLVARAGLTRARQLMSALDSLYGVQARVLGVVVNRMPPRSAAGYYGAPYGSEPDRSGERHLAPAIDRGSSVSGNPSRRA